MKPLEIRFYVTPVTQKPYKRKFPLHLDALLIKLLTGRKGQLCSLESDDPYAPEKQRLPIAVAGNKKPIYCASAAFCEMLGTDIYTYIRRPPEIEVWSMTRKREYKPAGEPTGKKKAVLEEMEVFTPKYIYFQCIGKKNQLEEILQDVEFLGTKRSVGFGQVYDIEIQEIKNKYAGLVTSTKMPARALPVEDWPIQNNWYKFQMAYKAPYWSAKNIAMCWSPEFDKTYPRMG